MSEQISWTNVIRKLGDLQPWERNPRQIREEQAARLRDSFHDFGQVEPIAIGPSDEVYNGHQRLNVLMAQYGPEYEIECRQASRALSEREREKLTVYLHKGAAGEWDYDILANEFDVADLLDWGFEAFELGVVEALDYSEYDEEADSLEGMTEATILITVPEINKDEIIEWLANGERKTGPGIGKGVMKRCGLL